MQRAVKGGISIMLGAVWGTVFPSLIVVAIAAGFGTPPYALKPVLLLGLIVLLMMTPFCAPLGAVGGAFVWALSPRLSGRRLILWTTVLGVVLGQLFRMITKVFNHVEGTYPHAPLWKTVAMAGAVGGATSLLFVLMYIRVSRE